MQKVDAAKTVSGRNRRLVLAVAGIVIVVGAIVLWFGWGASFARGPRPFDLESVASDEARSMGLSGREELAEGKGMLFVFDAADRHCMWMKDMKFSIDMVWLDDAKRIVDIAERVSPETYPESFCSDVPANYVIEVNAGAVQSAGLQRGDTVSF